ncbi:MAG: leucine-rich repeat domain-containing protein [Chloroflexota bacterium]
METTIATYLIAIFWPILARAIFVTIIRKSDDFTGMTADDWEQSLISPSEIAGDVMTGFMASGLVSLAGIRGLINRLTNRNREASDKAANLFEKIGKDAATNLVEAFRMSGHEMKEAEWKEAMESAIKTMDAHGWRLLIEENLNEDNFRRRLRTIPSSPWFSEKQQALYANLLDTAAQQIFAVAQSFPHFTRDTMAKLLQNDQELLRNMQTALDNMQTVLSNQQTILDNQLQILPQTYGRHRAEENTWFEHEYRTLIGSKLNNLQLFGVTYFDEAYQPLSVAYITLSVDIRNTDFQPVHDPTNDHDSTNDHNPRSNRRPVDEALATANRLLIVSEAGLGKTTLLKWIAVQAATGVFDDPNKTPYNAPLASWRRRIPFFLRLRDFANMDLLSPDKLATTIHELAILADSVPDGWTVQQLRNGRSLILVDGLDEVSNDKRREAVRRLNELLLLYPNNIVIINSRPSGLRDDPILRQQFDQHGFQTIELLPMDEKQIEQFVEQWHKAMGHGYDNKAILSDTAQKLLCTLKSHDDLRKLASSPILCAMLCALNLSELGELPRDRSRLYKRCIEILLQRDEDRRIKILPQRNEDRQVDANNHTYEPLAKGNQSQIQLLLARIAYWMMKRGVSTIHRKDVIRLLAESTLNAQPLLELLGDRSVIFLQQSDNEFDFIHDTFVEYLAGQGIVSAHEVYIVARDYGIKSEWHETLLLLAGHASPQDQADLLQGLYDLSQRELAHRRNLHFLAWSFWELLDHNFRVGNVLAMMTQHMQSLNLGGAPALNLRSTQVSDVSALTGLHNLQQLDLSEAQVSDVSALAGLRNLRQLSLMKARVKDVSALAGLSNLQQLDLRYTHVRDVSALGRLSNLQQLDLRSTQVSDVSALAELSNLQQLDLSGLQVSDVSALGGLSNLQQLDLSHTSVRDISALEGLSNLQQLHLSGSQVQDVSVLSGLSNLQQLDLRGTQVNNVSMLARLSSLQHLYLRGTRIMDVSVLGGLSNLQQLDLRSTQVQDVSALGGLSNLQQLDLRSTQVQDVSVLGGLSNLQRLDLRSTQVSDVSTLAGLNNLRIRVELDRLSTIQGLNQIRGLDISHMSIQNGLALERLSNLQQLDLSRSQVNDVSALAGLGNLQQLDLRSTQVRDISALGGLSNLQQLDLRLTQVNGVSALAELSNLQQLDLSSTQVYDVSALDGLSNLQQLDLRSTQVSDVSALGGLSNLQQLNLRSTQVRDVSALAGLSNLQKLYLSSSQVHDVSALVGLSNLQKLYLGGSQVQDVSVLAGLSNLQELYLRYTQVQDVSALAGLSNLQQLDLSSTQVADVSALVGLSNLQELDLSYTQVQDVSALAGLTNLRKLYLARSWVRDVSALRKALPELVIYS